MVHEEEESQLKSSLRQKTKIYRHLRHELQVSKGHFLRLNATLRNAKEEFAVLKGAMKDVKEHYEQQMEKASEWPSKSLAECFGVTLPHGYEYVEDGKLLFPHDIANDTSGLQ